ncbi:hypothetical protein L6164_007579 [Bauhinia variegata]|uniref:Uncharacterized protein n=1 Tax=Bauhinia variegata TaxID=167791 RepID=A0ACB9PE67_BAUVA|nr:hypothetical protein L6164_007579 [Bauhinia variegata]
MKPWEIIRKMGELEHQDVNYGEIEVFEDCQRIAKLIFGIQNQKTSCHHGGTATELDSFCGAEKWLNWLRLLWF